jgi:hypothetical protein
MDPDNVDTAHQYPRYEPGWGPKILAQMKYEMHRILLATRYEPGYTYPLCPKLQAHPCPAGYYRPHTAWAVYRKAIQLRTIKHNNRDPAFSSKILANLSSESDSEGRNTPKMNFSEFSHDKWGLAKFWVGLNEIVCISVAIWDGDNINYMLCRHAKQPPPNPSMLLLKPVCGTSAFEQPLLALWVSVQLY